MPMYLAISQSIDQIKKLVIIVCPHLSPFLIKAFSLSASLDSVDEVPRAPVQPEQ